MKGILGKLKRVAQAALVAGGFAFGANAEPTIKYTSPVYADGVASHGIAYWTTNTITTYTTVGSSSSAVTWGTSGATSWYVVPSGNFQIDGGITCQGHVNLILGEGAKLVVTNVDDYLAAIATDEEGSFTIYGQPDGAGVLEANPATGELERRRAELKQILKDAGYFNDPKPLEKLGFKLISGRTHWKLQYANVRITMSKTPSDYRASLNTASDTTNRCF